jgi:hypothetical protein
VGDVYNTNWGGVVPLNQTGVTFTKVLRYDSYAPSVGINVYYAILATAGIHSITFSYLSGATNNIGVVLSAYSGENAANPIAQGIGAKGVNSIPTLSIASLNSLDVLWSFTGSNSPTIQAAGSGFTLDRQNTYFGSPADEYGPVRATASFGTLVTQTWLLITVEVQ